MSNLKILIIPSWYPSSKHPLRGSFFQEQAQFLKGKGGMDFQVLYGEKKSSPLVYWIWIFIQSWLKPTWPISTEMVQQNPTAFGFDFPANRRIPDKLQIKLEHRIFLKAYKRLIRSGWIPDLIHAQSGMDAGVFAHHISQVAKVPFVILEHQVFVFHYYSKMRSTLIMDAFKAAQKTACVSWDQRRQVLMNQPNCNPEVIWNLVDENRYQVQLEKRSNIFTVITILNSLPIKGSETFLETMHELSKKIQDFRFIMIGKGADENSHDSASNTFIRKSKELGIYDIGTFFPFVARDHIIDVLNTAHVFVSPSIQEPFGIAVREAMLCGLPVVTTANGGVEDIITSETGLVVPIKDSITLAKAIQFIKDNSHHFDPEKIRSLTIKQCGRNVFLKTMSEFYKNNEIE